ncbi:hypothetical protein PSPO_a2525 [Pseudoalteromonas spongiae UST010723-006]|nr:hypothetical protein PSPO_a2525 [Pseudoalteromonas spongiae UST010723-006]
MMQNIKYLKSLIITPKTDSFIIQVLSKNTTKANLNAKN